jgi:hypothetical protein
MLRACLCTAVDVVVTVFSNYRILLPHSHRDNGSEKAEKSRDNRPRPAENCLMSRSPIPTRYRRCWCSTGYTSGAPTLPCVSNKHTEYVNQPRRHNQKHVG